MKEAEKEYGASSIQVLEGLEAVRKRPSMYIGDVGERGLHHLVYEVVDNSIDEALAGYCDRIDVTICEDNSIIVKDNGRGIPTGMMEKEHKSALEVVLTVLHAGGKFGKDNYKVSGGLHGVGVSCVNALSTKFVAEVHREGKIFRQEYSCGKPTTEVEIIGDCNDSGTIISFKPDASIFNTLVYQYSILAGRLRELAFLNKGVKLTLTDLRAADDKISDETEEEEIASSENESEAGMNLVAGAVLIISNKYFNRGWLQFVNSLIVFATMLLVFFAYRLITGGELVVSSRYLFLLFINALLVVACSPLSLLFEKLFSLVSRSRLVELTDINNTVLRMLARTAPGTFQHSLQVANLSESAARDINADTLLVRVGAMYHDIGKMNNPQCFIENQAPGVQYHQGLSMKESAMLIIKHVDDGMELAKKYNLPSVVVDFIKTHHAKSQTLYFYNKYCNEGGDPADIKDFTYNGEYPQTKEEVIVMMADAVEAASRSLKDYSEKSISDLVEKIVDARLSGNQLNRADISIREINIVKESFKRNLISVYNTRIAYPDRK